MAEALKEAGYTSRIWKMALGMHNKDQYPLQRGFDKFYGILAGGCNFFNHTPHG
jgi:arylsulfatase